MLKKVYICSPLGGDVTGNLENAKQYTEYVLKCGAAPVTPHFYALCLDDNDPKEREMGKKAAFALLLFSDEMWIFGDAISKGMQEEIHLCESLHKKTRRIRDKEICKLLGGNEL